MQVTQETVEDDETDEITESRGSQVMVMAESIREAGSDERIESNLSCLATASTEHSLEVSATQDSTSVRDSLLQWALKEPNVPRCAISRLLQVLQKFHPSLPRTAAALFRDPPNLVLEDMNGGEYVHIPNWTDSLKAVLRNQTSGSLPNKLLVNVDGVSLFDGSPNFKTYPILVKVKGIRSRPICAGIYCSNKSLNREIPEPSLYMKTFLEDISQLTVNCDNEILIDKNLIFVCDAPVRSSLKLIKAHSGYNSCERCTVPEEYHSHRICLLGTSHHPRTDDNFLSQSDEKHHKGRSVLAEFGISMVTNFPLDYMHLVCLGVCRRMIMWWKGTKKQFKGRLRLAAITKLSKKIEDHRNKIPCEFNWKMRTISDIKYWKASEFRLFLIYCSFVFLKDKDIMESGQYQHMLNFAVAVRIFLGCANPAKIALARTLMKVFVDRCATCYGRAFMSYNVHSLIHLADDCLKFGSLETVCCFPFESYLGVLKNSLKGRYKPLQQLSRFAFCSNTNIATSFEHEETSAVVDLNNSGIVVPDTVWDKQFKSILLRPGCLIKGESDADSIISFRGCIASVCNIVQKDSENFLL